MKGKNEMKKFGYARIIVLVLSLALLIGSAMAITSSAEEVDTTGKFNSISVAYGDRVAIRVAVNATEAQIKNGEVVVSYTLNGNTKNAVFSETINDGQVWVITEGIAVYDLAKIVEFDSFVGEKQVEDGRTYSVAQFLYKMLYTGSEISEVDRNLYESLLAYGKASQIALNQNADALVTSSTVAFSDDKNINFDGKGSAFAPAAGFTALTPVWKGDVTSGYEVKGWSILDNGEAKNVGASFKCDGIVKVVAPIFGIKYVEGYSVENGDFENGLNGWEFNNTLGEAPFAGVHNNSTFWDQNYPMFNVGNYFSAYAPGAAEGSQGTLASSYFTVGGQYVATYMLGGAGNHDTYITLENEEGKVLALYRNTEFMDFGDGHDTVGENVFLANFVSYKVDLSAFAGQKVRFVIHDHASSGWGVVFFDELITYYGENDTLPEGAINAKNLLANKTALNAELALEITEQGDYTADTYNAYVEKLNAAKALVDDIAVTQATVNAATEALTAAREALAVREIQAVENAETAFRMTKGKSRELNVADYINVNALSSISYTVKVGEEILTVTDGKFTFVATEVGDTTISITALYKGEAKLTVDITINVTNDVSPVLKAEEVVKVYDIFDLTNKTDILLDFAENVNNSGELELTYSVKHGDNTINGATYNFTFGEYTEAVVYEIFTVTVSYVANGEAGTLEYTYTLGLNDTTAYRVVNGGFEDGNLNGWTGDGNGQVTNANAFFNGREYGKDGNWLYSGVQDQGGVFLETKTGVLTSSAFKIGGSGYISFMLGGGENALCYVQVVDATTGEVLARYHQQAQDEAVLKSYVADLTAYIGKTVKFQVVDYAVNNWGCVSFDNLATYHTTKPEGLDAIDIKGNIKYTIDNGGFESGNLDGWTMNITEAGAHNTLGWVIETEIDAGWYAKNDETKEGRYLLSFAQPGDINCENTKGTLQSSTFSLKQGAFVAFKFGGAGGGSNHDVYVELCRADGSVIARFFNDAEGKVNTRMNAYYYKYEGVEVECFFRVVDNSTGDYGCFVVDDFRVNLESAPEGFIAAIQ